MKRSDILRVILLAIAIVPCLCIFNEQIEGDQNWWINLFGVSYAANLALVFKYILKPEIDQ